jgi:hypothetical protein
MNAPGVNIFQLNALRVLDDLRVQFESGNGFALLAAIRCCANHDLVMPEWVANAYIAKYDPVLNCTAKSWDEVFGSPYAKGLHISKRRRRRVLRFDVYLRIENILRTQPDTGIDDSLFETVGAQVGIGKTLCNEMYYEAKELLNKSLPRNS